jgi:hypothetical protein
MSRARFEPVIPVFEKAKTVYASDRGSRCGRWIGEVMSIKYLTEKNVSLNSA